ncbi:MAG: hypothetical protein AAF317_19260, partial [Pseudomonadota bacterium]
MARRLKSLIPTTLGTAYKQYKLAKSGIEVLKDFTSVLGFLFPPLLGVFGFDKAVEASVDIGQMGLPARLLTVVVCAAILGLGLGYAVSWLTRKNATVTVVLSGLISIAWALLLTTLVDAVTREGAGRALPEFALFFLVGFGLMLWCLTFQMRAQLDVGNKVMVRDRSQMIFLFAATAVFS